MNLPKQIHDIAELCGFESALALVKHFGGTRLKVPKGIMSGTTKAVLENIMGGDAAAKFMAVYGGEELAIAKCAAALRAERDQRIIDDYDAKMPIRALVAKYGLAERQLRTILGRVPGEALPGYNPAEMEDRQLDMFEG